MSDVSDATAVRRDVRTEPRQRRSVERIDLLLDTAAAIIDELGVNGLSTSAVATRSRSSVGVVYRYFPNIESLLLALADRNMALYLERLEARIEEEGLPEWRSLARIAILAYADLARTVPGFRTIRFGDIIVFRFPEIETDSNRTLATRFAQIFVERFGFAESAAFLDEMEIALEVADALTRRAFLSNREGDERIIERTIALEIDLLAPFAPKESA